MQALLRIALRLQTAAFTQAPPNWLPQALSSELSAQLLDNLHKLLSFLLKCLSQYTELISSAWRCPSLLQLLIADTAIILSSSSDDSHQSSADNISTEQLVSVARTIAFLKDLAVAHYGADHTPLPWQPTVAILYELVYRIVQAASSASVTLDHYVSCNK